MEEFNIIMGEKLRKTRIIKGIKQENIAKDLNISQQAYSQLENGYRNFTPALVSRLCEILEINMVDFLSFGSAINVTNGEVHTQKSFLSFYNDSVTIKETLDAKDKIISLLEKLIEEKDRKIQEYETLISQIKHDVLS